MNNAAFRVRLDAQAVIEAYDAEDALRHQTNRLSRHRIYGHIGAAVGHFAPGPCISKSFLRRAAVRIRGENIKRITAVQTENPGKYGFGGRVRHSCPTLNTKNVKFSESACRKKLY